MNKSVYDIILDVHKQGSQVFLPMVRGDTGRIINISLTENGKPYIIGKGCRAQFAAVKPDGNFICNDCAVDIQKNIITYAVSEQTTPVIGEVKCQIKMTDGGEILSTPQFGIVVGETLYSDLPIVESSVEFKALEAYIAELDRRVENGEFKGEKGDKGEPGATPVIDQTYSPTSENAQSGTAVSEAIEQKPGKKTSGGGEIFNNLSSNLAAGEFSHAEGSNNKVATPSGGSDVPSGADIGEFDKGTATHIEGMFNTGDGVGSHIEGLFNKASENGSHTEGVKNTNNGKGTHVEGGTNEASGDYAHVEGAFNYGYGNYSHAGGTGNITRGTAQTIIGKYAEEGKNDNAKPSEKQLFAVGNGTAPDKRSNALALYESGKLEVNNDTVYPNGDQAQMFLRGVCIGDSLTEGMYNNDGAQFFKKGKTYPDYLKKLMPDTQLTNAGFTGDTAMQWWIHSANTLWVNNEYDRGAVQQDKRAVFSWDCNGLGYDFAVIELGVNDGLQTGKTSEEIVSEFKEAMGNICNKLIASNAGIKIFIANIIPLFHRSLEIYIKLNQSIEEICSAKGAYLIDLTASSEITYDSDYNCGGHPSAAGYQKLAKEIYSLICVGIRANAEDFTEEQLADVNLEAPQDKQDRFAKVTDSITDTKLQFDDAKSTLTLSTESGGTLRLNGVGTPLSNAGAANKYYVDTETAKKQNKFADIDTGSNDVDITINGITNDDAKVLFRNDYGQVLRITAPNPIIDSDVANKKYVDNNIAAETKRANNTFANALKGNVSGEAVTMKDVSPVTHDMGVKVRGKNLIPYPFTYETFQHNGITFTDNKDGTITLNGQNNGSGISNYNLFQSANDLSFLKPNTDYYLSCNLDNIIKSLRTVKLDGTYKYYTYGKINFSSDETPDRLFIQIKTTDTTTYDNTIVKLQIELGDTATAYTPYVPDLTAVKVSKQGKNLIPFPYQDFKLGTSTYNGVDFTVYEDGSILINGTATSSTTRYLYRNITGLLGLKSGITISGNKNASDDTQQANVYFMCNYYDSAGKMQEGISMSAIASGKKTITEDWKGLGIYLNIPKGNTLDNLLIKPQIAIGDTADNYEPYITPTEYTPDTDGIVEGVTSLYPTTTLTIDTAGAIIDCEYNRDTNKAYSDLLQRIAALEAAVINNI